MAIAVYGNDTYYEVYGQNLGRVSRENFIQYRPHTPRKRKAFRDDRAKAEAWDYAIELVERAEREGADPAYAIIRIRFHEPGAETKEVWLARAGDERWARMAATAAAKR